MRGKLPETQPAHTEFSDECPGPAAKRTTIICADLKLLFKLRLGNKRFFCHTFLLQNSIPGQNRLYAGYSLLLSERHTQQSQQGMSLVIGFSRRYYGNIQSPNLVDLIKINFRENNMLFDTQ